MAVYTTTRTVRRSRARHFTPKPQRPVDLGGRLDAIVLAVLAGASAASCGAALGFTGSDWESLASVRGAAQHGTLALFRAMSTDPLHPVAAVAATVEYACFGFDPAGYHVVLGALGVGVVVAFYAALRRCGVPRALALGCSLAVAFAPNADRFTASPQSYLGLAFFFASLHAGFSVRGATPTRALGFALATLAAGCAATLCCTFALPLVAASAIIFARRGWSSRALAGAVAAAVILAAAFDLAFDVGSPAAASRAVAEGWNGSAVLPLFATSAASPSPLDVLLGIVVGLVTAGLVLRVALLAGPPRTGRARRLAGAGCSALVVGLVAFAFGDRTCLVAGLGIAMACVGSVATLSGVLPGSRLRAAALAAVVGLSCGLSETIGASASSAWRETGRNQVRLIADVVDRTAGLPRRAVVLIGGACPGTPFPSAAEATDALRFVLGRSDVRVEFVSASMRIGGSGRALRTLKGIRHDRPDDATIGFDAATRTAGILDDVLRARRFVASAEREVAEQCT